MSTSTSSTSQKSTVAQGSESSQAKDETPLPSVSETAQTKEELDSTTSGKEIV